MNNENKDQFNESNKNIYNKHYSSRNITNLANNKIQGLRVKSIQNKSDDRISSTYKKEFTVIKANFSNINSFSFKDELLFNFNRHKEYHKNYKRSRISIISITETQRSSLNPKMNIKKEVVDEHSSSTHSDETLPYNNNNQLFTYFNIDEINKEQEVLSIQNKPSFESFDSSSENDVKISTIPKLDYKINKILDLKLNSNITSKLANSKDYSDYLLQKLNFKSKLCIISYLKIEESIRLVQLISKKINNSFITCLFFQLKTLILDNNHNRLSNQLWLLITKLSNLPKDNCRLIEYYNKCFNKKSVFEDDINKDILRTNPEDSTYKKGNLNYFKLKSILISYSNYNLKVGYAQGMNFIVASLITLIKEEHKCFIYLDSLVKRFYLTKMYSIHNHEIINKLRIIENLIVKFCPLLNKYFDSIFVNHEFFTTQWIITLFASSMEENLLFKFWDFCIVFGWKFVYHFIIQILITFEKRIINYDYNLLSSYMKNLLKTDEFQQSFESIITNAFELMKLS